MQCPQDAPLHRFQAIREVWNRAIPDYIAGIIHETAIHPRVQPGGPLFGIERPVRNGRHRFRHDMIGAIAIACGLTGGRDLGG